MIYVEDRRGLISQKFTYDEQHTDITLSEPDLYLRRVESHYSSGTYVDILVGERVVVYYNSGDVIVYDFHDGEYQMGLILPVSGELITIPVE